MTVFIRAAGQSWMWSTPSGFLPCRLLRPRTGRDLIFLEQRQRVIQQVSGPMVLGSRVMNSARMFEPALDVAAKVTISDHADKVAIGVGHANDAEAFRRHFNNRVVHRAVRPSQRQRFPECMRRGTGLTARRASPRWSRPKSLRVKPRWRMTVMASASPARGSSSSKWWARRIWGRPPANGEEAGRSAGIGERGPGMRSNGDDGDLSALEMIDYRLELGGFAALRDEHRDVPARAMPRSPWMASAR